MNYTMSLMEEQMKFGHRVFYFCVGRYNFLCPISYIKRWHLGHIEIFELVNPSRLVNKYGLPLEECANLPVEKAFLKVLRKAEPDIIHIQELSPFCGSIIDIARNEEVPLTYSLHNYWPICPQVELLDENGDICTNFKEGRKCVECRVRIPTSPTRIMARAYIKGTRFYLPAKRVFQIFARMKKLAKSEKPLLPSLKYNFSLAPYFYYRRYFFVDRLNKLDSIIANSQRVKEIYVSMGVEKEKIHVLYPINRVVDSIKPKTFRGNQYPIVFGFVGGASFHKGINILINAFRQIGQNRSKLIIYGVSKESPRLPYLLEISRGLNIEFRNSFKENERQQVLEEIDVGVIPSVWEETLGIVGIEFLKARIPVIGSRIGGIPEYIDEGKTGYLFEPRNSRKLAEKMKLFIDDPNLILVMQHHIKPLGTFSQHIKEVLDVYSEIVNSSCKR